MIEATWRVPVHEQLTVQPDLQYVFRPGGLYRDALVLGLRLALSAGN